MKKVLLNNIGLKIISVIFAAFLWLIVINVDDSYTSRAFSNIKVEIINENQLTEQKKSWTVLEGEQVTVTLRAKRSILDGMKSEDIKAVADLSKLSITNAVPIEVSVARNASDIREISLGKVNTLKVYLEDTKSEQFAVTISLEGEAGKGYAIAEKSAVPNLVTVTGPQSLVDKVEEVRVLLNVQGETQSKTVQLEPVYYDSSGNRLDGARLTCNVSTIEVNLKVYETKTVPVVVKSMGTVADGYGVKEINYEPKEVTVAAPTAVLESLSNIVIDDVDVTGKSADFEKTLDLKDYLPNKVIMGQESTEIMINVKIERLVQKTYNLSPSDITLENVPEGLNAKALDPDAKYTVVLQGYKDILDDTDLKDLDPKIDLTDVSEGTHIKYVTFVLKENMKLSARLKVSIICNRIK